VPPGIPGVPFSATDADLTTSRDIMRWGERGEPGKPGQTRATSEKQAHTEK
jgi:hypothetical protein